MESLALLTTLSSQDKESILSLATDHQAGNVFGGSQSGDIHVGVFFVLYFLFLLICDLLIDD